MSSIYISPDGSVTGAGTRVKPYDLTTGLTSMSAADTLIFMDGIYRIPGATITLAPELASFQADDGARPIVTRSDDKCPVVDFKRGVKAKGIWFGSTLPNEVGPLIYLRSQVELDDCVFFGFYLGIGEGPQIRNHVRRCKFINCGYANLNHAVYVSNNLAKIGEGILLEENTFIGGGGYSLHFWSAPTVWTAKYNFFGNVQRAIVTGGSGECVGNIIWSNRGVGGSTFGLFFPASSTAIMFKENVIGPNVTRFLDPTYNVQFVGNRFYESDVFGDDPIVWSFDDVKNALGKNEIEINQIIDIVNASFSQSVDDLAGDLQIGQAFDDLDNIIDRMKATNEPRRLSISPIMDKYQGSKL